MSIRFNLFFILFYGVLQYTSLAQMQANKTPGVISLNQSGYNVGWPKRFTAPLAKNGTSFKITERGKEAPLFEGEITDGIGDFTAFNPDKPGTEYMVKVNDIQNQSIVSYPFSIRKFWLQNELSQPALDFMIDCRSVTGTHASAYGGTPWRDGTTYSYEVPSLVLQYLSNPFFYDHAPIQINYLNDKKRVLAPGFKYINAPEGQNALATTKKYYSTIDAPVGNNIPDIIQLIHWGVGFYMLNPVTQDPSGGNEGRRLHPQTLEQFAYFMYGYPYYKQYFTDSFYKQVKKFTSQQWGYTGLLGIFNTIGTAKGREAPGHSIMPNLMMYTVAKRDGDVDAEKYLNAAYTQTKWIIDSLDLKDPRTTKGQRMSEHLLVPALTFFLKEFPDKAPQGLKQKIETWSDIAISRSNNMWDFRRYDTGKLWTVPGLSETGNITGFAGIALAAADVTDDPQKKERLKQLAIASIDDLFGRNPINSCSAFHHNKGFSHLEKGWPKSYHDDVCARLELVRGTFSSISTTDMYPYNPDGKMGWLEGWTAFNAAWNKSLAYMNNFEIKLKAMDKSFKNEQTKISKENIYLQIEIPVPSDLNGPQEVSIDLSNGKQLQLKQITAGNSVFRGILKGSEIQNETLLAASYGYGLFKKSIGFKKSGANILINP